MTREPGELYQVLILSVLLSCVAAWIIAHRYRRRMQHLMRAPRAEDPLESNACAGEVADNPMAVPVSLADNRAAGMRLAILLIAASFLLAGTSACIYCLLKFPGDPLLPWRLAPITLLHLWPVVPALALIWRWSGKRLFATLLLWCAATFIVLFAIALWRQIEMRPSLLLGAMASDIGLSLVLLLLVFLGNATRAIAPWLVMPAALLAWSSLAGVHAMMYVGEHQSPFVMSLIRFLEPWLGWLPWYGVLLLFVLLPWVLVWWLARALGRTLGRAYSRKRLSDLLVVFTGVWVFALTDRAVMVVDQAGVAALGMYLPLLWIPTVMLLGNRWRPRRERPPTLLVLRVFQQDAQAQSLYDQVVERWRLSGNTVMIAGTDLADRTLDADDIFGFLDRKLAERFIVSASDVPRRIAEMDMSADIDGRYRVNKCYCHDTTWQDALQALVRCSDVVLMDLRGFQAHNAGCRYELTTLAHESRDLRVVVLTDGRTDRIAAKEAVASGRQERFTWVEASHFNASKHRQVLERLFVQ